MNKVSLNIEAGSFVGIVGQSGSGKSTLMKLLPRLYELENGRVFIDDYDIGKVELSSLSPNRYCSSRLFAFEGSISENIALNDPQATDESIIEAAKLACAHDFIMSLPDGYATILSERGSNLSGVSCGQRIAIAEQFLSNPQLLVMDEATSALDYNTETQLCQNLQSWAKNRTVLFITHRLSSIKSSDLILVMHEGHLIEQGTHEQLMDLGERYAALYQQQGQ